MMDSFSGSSLPAMHVVRHQRKQGERPPTTSRDHSYPRNAVSCLNCQKRHRKCDDRPECLQCVSAQIECVRTKVYRLRLKSSGQTFIPRQPWVPVAKQLHFVTEDPKSDAEDHSCLHEPNTEETPSRSDSGSRVDVEVEFASNIDVLTNNSASSELDPFTTATSEAVDHSNPAQYPSHSSGVSLSSSGSQPTSPQDSNPWLGEFPFAEAPPKPFLTISNACEANLFRHYLDNLLIWFEFDDPEQIFRRHVILQVTKCNILMQAIYALTSRQLSNLGQFDPSIADKYHETCINLLIQSLDPISVVDKDHVFAATVILRTKEEFDTTWHGSDHEAHILGIKSITNSEWFSQNLTPLRRRLYWIALRQEISFALVKQRPLDINLCPSFTNGPFDLTSETDWANSNALNLAHMILFAFDDEPKTRERYLRLCETTSRLYATIPPSFQPFYESASSVQDDCKLIFPKVWVASNFGSFAMQHLIICRILLTCFNPTLPQAGPGSYLAAQKKTNLLTTLLRRLCGLGTSHSKFGPCMILACMGVAICGDHFTDEKHREAVLDILVRTEGEHAYPTASIQSAFRKVWDTG